MKLKKYSRFDAMRFEENEICREEHEYMLKFLLVGDSDVGKDEIADLLGPSVSYTPDALFIRNFSCVIIFKLIIT